jgi:hypothetical protein
MRSKKMIKLKLKEITEPREGFVYEYEGCYILCGNPKDFEERSYAINSIQECSILKEQYRKPIGKLGLTHKIEDGKLVELPRREIEVGDIIHGKTITYVEYDEDPVSFQEYLKEVYFLYDGSIVPYDQREEIDDLYEELSEFGRQGILNVTHGIITEYEEE